MSALRSSIASSLRWIYSAKLFAQLLNWGITFMVLRLLAPSDYGLMAMAAVFVSFISMFADMGLGVAVIQSKECSRERLAEIFGAVLLLNVSLTALLALLAGPIAQFFDEPRLVDVLRVLSLQFTIAAFSAMPKAWLQREMRFKAFSFMEVSGSLLTGVSTLLFAWQGFGVWALVLGNMIGIAWPALMANWLAPLKVWPSFNFVESAEMLRVGRNVTTSRVLWYFMSQVDVFIVGKLLGKEMLGFYSVAIQLSSMPMTKVMSVVNQVALSGFARIQDDRFAVRQAVLQGVTAIAFIAFPIFWGMASVAAELVVVVLGEQWQQAVLPLQLVPLVVPLRMISVYMTTAAQGIGRSDVDVRNTFLGALVMPSAFLVGCQWGLVGVCLAWVLAMPLLYVRNIHCLLQAMDISPPDFLRALVQPGLIAAMMSAAVYLAHSLFLPLLPALPLLLLQTAVGLLIYMGIYWIFAREDIMQVIRFVKG